MDRQIRGRTSWANFANMVSNSKSHAFERPFPTNLEIGTRLRAARKRRGWTIAEMAEVGEIKAVVIGSYERGSRNMPLSRLGELAAILNVDISYLLGQTHLAPLSESAITLDLRALSRPTAKDSNQLTIMLNYCAAIARKRNDWNGEVLSIRNQDLRDLSFAIGIEEPELLNWLNQERYLLTGISQL